MKLLLIDDLALKGWKSVIEKSIIKNVGELEVALNYQEAVVKISEVKYSLIFLDSRLTEEDHQNKKSEDLTGFKILNKIRESFESLNFSTPIILITASNKIWTVDLFKQYGIDSFYTKEHPDYIISKEASRENLYNLQKSFTNLLKISKDRDEILSKILGINKIAETSIDNVNIRKRIKEKLKIGYGLLFRKTSKVEKENLLFNNEIIAFIVFWSILEEVSHDFYNRTNENEWTLRKSETKIQFFEEEKLMTRFNSIKNEHNIIDEISEIRNAHQISLSNQISGVLRYELGWSHHLIHSNFLAKLNKYRNDIDFIHSSTNSILSQSLENNQENEAGYKKCKQMLEFISKILK